MENFDETFIKDYCDDNFAEYLSLKKYLLLKDDSREIEEKEIFIQGMRESYFLFKKLDLLK